MGYVGYLARNILCRSRASDSYTLILIARRSQLLSLALKYPRFPSDI